MIVNKTVVLHFLKIKNIEDEHLTRQQCYQTNLKVIAHFDYKF
jgi:hypothetical protein